MRHAELAAAGPGVDAVIAKPDRGAVGNAAVVDLGDETLVIDTHLTPAAARELRAAAEEVAGRSVSQVLNTHWHADHVLGNREFPGAAVTATARTRELMASVGVERLKAQKQWLEAELPAELERLRAAGGTVPSAGGKPWRRCGTTCSPSMRRCGVGSPDRGCRHASLTGSSPRCGRGTSPLCAGARRRGRRTASGRPR